MATQWTLKMMPQLPDIETALRDYANGGYDLIIARGFEWGNQAMKVGKDYPEYQANRISRTCKLH